MAPEHRQRFLQENIKLNIVEVNNCLTVKVLLRKVQQRGYPGNAKIILEAYNRVNIERLQLGNVENYKEEEGSYTLPFEIPLRSKINFRLKIIDPDSFKLLGYAENLKEEKYARSMLDINTEDENVKNIYKIDFSNPEHPVLYLNPELKIIVEKLKPLLAEMVFKDILNFMFTEEGEEYRKHHKWFNFANKFCPYNEAEKQDDDDYNSNWINQVLCAFAEKNRLIKSLTKEYKTDD